ncbi:MAG: hypothetical protein CL927_01000 [Deltaproteobacteria bacterium]|nr:hypothetical protein [Deltaproteobacteria bacterium]HCH62713.1 hypothetical protein [Deltaproteobacteria bacterium]|tara:strand:- start:282 stop:623 length:342 start_codon:yes stop_codon:yes gene_type:complete
MTLDLASVPVIDRSLREELDMVGGPQLHPRLVGIFMEDVQAMRTELDAALHIEDAPAAKRIAHRVKGGAAAIGARRVAMVASALESAAREGSLASAQALRPQLDVELDALARA